jgi:hypothetical protein
MNDFVMNVSKEKDVPFFMMRHYGFVLTEGNLIDLIYCFIDTNDMRLDRMLAMRICDHLNVCNEFIDRTKKASLFNRSNQLISSIAILIIEVFIVAHLIKMTSQ